MVVMPVNVYRVYYDYEVKHETVLQYYGILNKKERKLENN